ncbi:hypothetical protein L9F63_012881, partial [Diploptera punctata]
LKRKLGRFSLNLQNTLVCFIRFDWKHIVHKVSSSCTFSTLLKHFVKVNYRELRIHEHNPDCRINLPTNNVRLQRWQLLISTIFRYITEYPSSDTERIFARLALNHVLDCSTKIKKTILKVYYQCALASSLVDEASQRVDHTELFPPLQGYVFHSISRLFLNTKRITLYVILLRSCNVRFFNVIRTPCPPKRFFPPLYDVKSIHKIGFMNTLYVIEGGGRPMRSLFILCTHTKASGVLICWLTIVGQRREMFQMQNMPENYYLPLS